jgi:predicted RNA-binding Zn-ribbon protein involved in translation (DUF1610 family)
VDLTGTGYDFAVVGESFYQDNLRRIAGRALANGETVVITALLVPDPDNPFSRSGRAMMITAEGGGCVGHFPEGEAVRYTPVWAALRESGKVGSCPGWLTGGAEGMAIGLQLALRSVEDCAAALGVAIPAAGKRPAPRPTTAPTPAPGAAPRETEQPELDACPHCATPLAPPPRKIKWQCPSCAKVIMVRNGPDGRRHFLREDQVKETVARWAEERERKRREHEEEERRVVEEERIRRETDRAQGVVFDEGGNLIEVVGESRFRAELSEIVSRSDRTDDGSEWEKVSTIATLTESGSAIRVTIDGKMVGFLSNDVAEKYAGTVRLLAKNGRTGALIVRASIVGKDGIYGVKLQDVPDPGDCAAKAEGVASPSAANAAEEDDALTAVVGEELTRAVSEASRVLGRPFNAKVSISASDGRADVRSRELEEINRASGGRVMDDTRRRLRERLGRDAAVYLIEE